MVSIPQNSTHATSQAGGRTPAPRPKAVPAKRPPHRLSGLAEDSLAWGGSLAAYAALTLAASLIEGYGQIIHQPLLLFFFGLSLLAALLPASGPRGQRIALLPGVGLAMCLLVSPFTATLPLLLANALYAAARDTPAARRGVLGRGVWLTLATLAGGFSYEMLKSGPFPEAHSHHSLPAVLLASTVYVLTYTIGRQIGLWRGVAARTSWGRSWLGGRLETAGLLATVPVVVLMTQLIDTDSSMGQQVSVVAGTAGLMALLLLVAHFGFEVAQLREQVRAMEKISAVTLSQTNPARVIERFLQLSYGLIPCDRSTLWLTDDSQTRLERVARRQSMSLERRTAGAEAVPTSLRFGEGLVGRVADRQQPLIVRAGARDPRLSEAEGRNGIDTSALLLPLVAGGETVGVVQFEREAPGGYTPRDMVRVRSLASQVAATIANIRMHRDIYNQAVTDGLTGLYNRRHMQTVLLDERLRASRYNHTLSVIMLDVDGFKSYNDTYGHPQGDVLLKKLAALLKEKVREVDVVGRYGGEEFIIVMPETSKQEAWLTAERLRASVEAAIFPGFADDPDMAVLKTISLGLATFPHDTDDIQTLVSLADQALYRAKRGGRNQVVTASPSFKSSSGESTQVT